MAEVAGVAIEPGSAVQGSRPAPWLWLLGIALCANAVLLFFGMTTDAITVGQTLKKEAFGIVVRLVDERQTYSVLSAILTLRQRDHLLFVVVFLFSVVFPIVKLAANALAWVSMVRTRLPAGDLVGRVTNWLHSLGRLSMLDVLLYALTCVFLRGSSDITRFTTEPGMYWFVAAVLLSLANASWTERAARHAVVRAGA
jgi:hypothetical protein